MHVLIVAVNDQIQYVESAWGQVNAIEPKFERCHKEKFKHMLRELVRARRVAFIGEEAKPVKTIAQTVCEDEDMGCAYANIDMPDAERKRRGMGYDYNCDPTTSADQKAEFNRQREEYMVNHLVDATGSAQSVILICGWEHKDALASRLGQAGHCVETTDLRHQSWYKKDWSMGKGGLGGQCGGS